MYKIKSSLARFFSTIYRHLDNNVKIWQNAHDIKEVFKIAKFKNGCPRVL